MGPMLVDAEWLGLLRIVVIIEILINIEGVMVISNLPPQKPSHI